MAANGRFAEVHYRTFPIRPNRGSRFRIDKRDVFALKKFSRPHHPPFRSSLPILGPRGIMPSLSTLLFASFPLLLIAIIWQNPDPIIKPITGHIAFKIIRQFFETTHCYVSVKTNSARLPHAECFSVSNGKFSRVFIDETSFPVVKEARKGHVIPGLWDGHGHLLPYGELMDSVNLFGAQTMDGVKERLVRYKASRPEAGTAEQWLRGMGWDQANFEGKWPVAVSGLSPGLTRSPTHFQARFRFSRSSLLI